MENVVWEMTHSVETDGDVDFAWRYWSDVGNWDDPPATFELEGAFQAGARGWTRMPGQPAIAWFVREVWPDQSATIEIPADGAVMSFEWRFVKIGEGRTRITQRLSLRGDRAEQYLGFAKTFETNLPHGMKKMASAIADAARRPK
jgi:polyketide cyclase/dehydrase/lipid transport protein